MGTPRCHATILAEIDFLCLTDMWRAAGGDESRRPIDWLRRAEATQFIDFLKVANGHLDLVQADRGGREPGTWAHWQVGMAYAGEMVTSEQSRH
jgi:hypothetical protein